MTEGAPFEIIILKAAYLSTKGGTSAAIVAEIEGKCFERLRDLLRRWKRYFEKLYAGEEWTGPDPERCSLHRLAGGGGVISDTCNAARKAKRLLVELIQAEQVLREEMGDGKWDALSITEREELLLVAEASRLRVASRRIASRRIATSSSRRRCRRAVAL